MWHLSPCRRGERHDRKNFLMKYGWKFSKCYKDCKATESECPWMPSMWKMKEIIPRNSCLNFSKTVARRTFRSCQEKTRANHGRGERNSQYRLPQVQCLPKTEVKEKLLKCFSGLQNLLPAVGHWYKCPGKFEQESNQIFTTELTLERPAALINTHGTLQC